MAEANHPLMDAHGNMAVEDTATGEVMHKPAHIAQEILSRNPDGRFKVLQKTANTLADKRDADPKKRQALINKQADEGRSAVVADATDVSAGKQGTPPAVPFADTADLPPEVPADEKKAAKIEAKEAKADDAK